MPQFDFTTYSSQIFWFSICFFVLYYCMSNIILPRVRSIIAERKTIVNDDLSSANANEQAADEIRTKTNDLLLDANLKYKAAIDAAIKDAAAQRDASLEKFKENADFLIKKSQEEILKVIQNSESKNRAAIEQLVLATENKIFNS